MNSLLRGSTAAAAILVGLAGSAEAQVVGIDDLAGIADALTPTIRPVTVDLDALTDIEALPTGMNGAYLNTAVNIGPQVNTNLQFGLSPLGATTSTVAIGNLTQTAVGTLANQGNQTVAAAIETSVDKSTSQVNSGTSMSYGQTVATTMGSALGTTNSVGGSMTAGGFTSEVADLATGSIAGPLTGVYAANLAANLAPQVNTNVQVAASVAAANLSQTGVGVLANQINSIGLDGSSLAGAITGGGTADAD